MTPLPNYTLRVAAALLFWLALVLWGSAIVNFYPGLSGVTTQAYRVLASALAPFGMVWAFWSSSALGVLVTSAALALSGSLVLAMQA